MHAGNSTEHTHRPALKVLIESLTRGITATNEPKRVQCGAPDFIVSRDAAHGPITLGYIEAKDVGKDLSETERSDQMKRYLPALQNLILTNYLEFRWYVDGQERGNPARLARSSREGKLVPEKGGGERVSELLTEFLSHQPQSITSPKQLALRMARLTHFIRDIIVTAFDTDATSPTLADLHKAFEKTLIPDLPIAQFADMFAQTLAYGLFAARVNHRGPRGTFRRLGAAAEIPKTNPFLRQLFETITGTALEDEPFVVFVDDLAQLLSDTDIEAVLANFGKRTAREDPVVHFYETFLAAYDPKLREARGVYYTPEPVVSYIVRSVDHLLRSSFGCANGLADTTTIQYEREEDDETKGVRTEAPRVLILDPACGTGTFLYSVIDQIRREFGRQGNAGMWSGYVRNHLLPRIFGFELLMAPYAVAHFKLGMQLAGYDMTPAQRERWAYDFAGDERLGVYLTNTLEEAERRAETLFGPLRVITQEANAASEIKRNLPILAVIGNPPYSGISSNMGNWIDGLLRGELPDGTRVASYYQVDGRPLGEKKVWLQDDYVKFIRWGQWRIERTGAGVLAFVTNHGYLDNPTFRGMRQALMNSFSDIYVLDLHGSSKKRQTAPGGAEDRNVFDIQQGVAISIFVKQPDKHPPAQIFHADLWGPREQKYDWLFEHDAATTAFEPLKPSSPFYFFVPRVETARAEHDSSTKVTQILPVNNAGIVTARDGFVFDVDKDRLLDRISEVRSHTLSDEDIRAKYFEGKGSARYPTGDTRGWRLPEARQHVRADEAWRDRVVECLYRPFDTRFLYYVPWMVDWPRPEVMRHMLAGENLALCTSRSVEIGRGFEHVFCTRNLIQHHTVSIKEVNYIFPLYIYPASGDQGVGQKVLEMETSHWPPGKNGRKPNLDPASVAQIETRTALHFIPDGKGDLRGTFGPEDVFDYIYALLHSPTYRARYSEFLKSDFPRVPMSPDANLFTSLCALGSTLVALHLLESPRVADPIARFPIKGSNLVEQGFPKYVAPGEAAPGTGAPLKEGRVYINTSQTQAAGGQYFEYVSPEAWDFHIGGYQVCAKWLKDRRRRTLTYGDLQHYCKTVTAVAETIRLMADVDSSIETWPIE